MQTKDKIEAIILKSIEGGYKLYGVYDFSDLKDRETIWVNLDINPQIKVVPFEVIVCESFFWQALGKACGWEKEFRKIWKYNALCFHETNLIEGFDKAIDFLFNLIQK